MRVLCFGQQQRPVSGGFQGTPDFGNFTRTKANDRTAAAGELLLQQRSDSKRLWPGFWSNSCCSHPRRGETLTLATRRRLEDELNVGATLEHVYKFQYQADFGAQGAEHELCHVFLGRLVGTPEPNACEIAALRFVGADDLDREFDARSLRFTPWFRLEWQTLRERHAARLDRYLRAE